MTELDELEVLTRLIRQGERTGYVNLSSGRKIELRGSSPVLVIDPEDTGYYAGVPIEKNEDGTLFIQLRKCSGQVLGLNHIMKADPSFMEYLKKEKKEVKDARIRANISQSQSRNHSRIHGSRLRRG